MTEQFTYPSLKCVLEYLEANKKFHITARSPTLRKFEKSVPLRLKHFSFEDWKICINDISFSFIIQKTLIEPASAGAAYYPESLESSEELLPGDLVLKYNNRPKYLNQVYIKFETNSFSRTKRVPDGMRIHEAMKAFAEILLGGRQTIHAVTLGVFNINQKILRVPENLKFTPRALDIGRHSLEEVLPMLELPTNLINLQITIWKPSYVENPIVQNVQYLTLWYKSSIHSAQFWLNILQTIPSKAIYLAVPNLKGKELRRIVENSIENGEVIGKSYIFQCSGRKFMDKTVMKVQKKFKGIIATFEEGILKEKYLILTQIVVIPIKDSTAELVIYGVQTYVTKNRFYIRMRVIETGSATPVEQNGGFLSWFQRKKTK